MSYSAPFSTMIRKGVAASNEQEGIHFPMEQEGFAYDNRITEVEVIAH